MKPMEFLSLQQVGKSEAGNLINQCVYITEAPIAADLMQEIS